jgi:hypothetical protein
MTGTGDPGGGAGVLDDVLAVARRPSAAAPREIRVRSGLYDRIRREAVAGRARVTVDGCGDVTHVDGIPLVADELLPPVPGFEVRRSGFGQERRAA